MPLQISCPKCGNELVVISDIETFKSRINAWDPQDTITLTVHELGEVLWPRYESETEPQLKAARFVRMLFHMRGLEDAVKQMEEICSRLTSSSLQDISLTQTPKNTEPLDK